MLTYPVHQAADILFCHANLVPSGWTSCPTWRRRGWSRGASTSGTPADRPVFPEPEALLTTTPMLAGLDGQKMGKSRGNGIALRATEDETAALIRRAPTDGERQITYDPASRPAVAGLLHLLAAVTGQPRRPSPTRSGAAAPRVSSRR